MFVLLLLTFVTFVRCQFNNDLCELITCPIDCDKKPTTNGCFDCQCTNTTRCSSMNCPCWTATKLDGCETCYCSGPTYSLLDDNKNVEMFLREGSRSGTRGVCSLEDRYGVDECLIPYKRYMKEIKAEIQLQPARELYPIFAYQKQHLPRLCQLFHTAEKCIGVNMLSRCRTQEKTLNALEVLLEPICRRNELSFVDHYDCLANLLKDNEAVRYCTRDAMNSIIQIESNANMLGAKKRAEKCESFNRLLECTRTPMVSGCSQAHWQLFLFAVQSSLPSVAPECYVNNKNRIAPLDNNYKPPFEVPEKFPVFTNNSAATDSYQSTTSPTPESVPTATEPTGSTTTQLGSTTTAATVATITVKLAESPATATTVVEDNSIFVQKGSTLAQIILAETTATSQPTAPTTQGTTPTTTSQSTTDRTTSRITVSPPGVLPKEVDSNNIKKVTKPKEPETPEVARVGVERCYKIPERHTKCVTRAEPQSVIRWYRKNNVCDYYMYNYCDPQTEKMEQPFRYEEYCYQECFSAEEKASDPYLRNLKFHNRFRLRAEPSPFR